MKMLTTFVLVCAGMALTIAAEMEVDKDTGTVIIDTGRGQIIVNISGKFVPNPGPSPVPPEECCDCKDGCPLHPSKKECPGGWSRHNHHCYNFVEVPQTWAIAERNCQAQGANLASVTSLDEQNFIKGMIERANHPPPAAWIGGSDAEQDDIWLWSDSSQFAFSEWCQGAPSNGDDEHCTEINIGDVTCWNDIDCTLPRPYVCEKIL